MESLKDTLKGRVAPKTGQPATKNTIHSQTHLLAKEISEYCGEPKKYGLYLGVLVRIGHERGAFLFGQLKDMANVRNSAKMFLFLSKKKNDTDVKPDLHKQPGGQVLAPEPKRPDALEQAEPVEQGI